MAALGNCLSLISFCPLHYYSLLNHRLVYFLLDSIITLETEFPRGFAEAFGAPLLRSCDARRPSLHIIGPRQTGHQGGAFLGTELLRLPPIIDKCCVGGGRDSRAPSKKQDSVLVSGLGV